MEIKKWIKRILLGLPALFILYIGFIFAVPRIATLGKSTDKKVYVAFGFHGNLYHSYRIDTNDEAGFGKDIRIIRKIIEVLDAKNREGIPVKGVWDIENLFSLEEQLPKYAPDIIKNIKRRVKENGDEVILMSYNNGLASSQTKREFLTSMKRAISNRKKSGVKDIFGEWSPYVRPQEMMTTPGNFDLYRSLGIEGICLYYSAVTFDAFRVFVPELSLEEAHNPLMYVNKESGEKMQIIPCYNHGDLIENISLKKWVRDLHREQLKGNIKGDVLLFLNTDADAEYWYGFKMPGHLSWLPNTGGLLQLIDSIKDLDYVKFTNLKEYLSTHKPKKEIFFGQDTADGSFNGYVSWSEKAYSHGFWKAVTDDRRVHEMTAGVYGLTGKPVPPAVKRVLDASYEKRLRIQSTTNFGLATPFLARTRERVVESLIEAITSLDEKARAAAEGTARAYMAGHAPPKVGGPYTFIDSIMIGKMPKVSGSPRGDFFTVTLKGSGLDRGGIYLSAKGVKAFPAYTVSALKDETKNLWDLRLYVPEKYNLKDGIYNLYRGPALKGEKFSTKASRENVSNGLITVSLNEEGHVEGVTKKGGMLLEKDSLMARIRYGGGDYRPEKLDVKVLRDGSEGVASISVRGKFTLPVDGTKGGHVDYRYTLIDSVPALFAEGEITWPDTPRKDVFKASQPSLARRYDASWTEAVPLEIKFAPRASKSRPFTVLKRNYLGMESSYLIDYFKHSDENLDLSNVNNHITAEYAAATNGKKGIAVAMDTTVLSNFAFCPMKIEYSFFGGFALSMNPFGTYFGEQYYQPTWSNQQGYLASFYNADQYQSAACTYSGHRTSFSLMIDFFEGDKIPEENRKSLISFARPPFVISGSGAEFPSKEIPVETPRGFIAGFADGGVYFHWEKPMGKIGGYKIYCGKKRDSMDRTYSQKGTESTLFKKYFDEGKAFNKGEVYYAAISALDSRGKETKRSPVLSFIIKEPKKGGVNLPIWLQLKVLWATVLSYID